MSKIAISNHHDRLLVAGLSLQIRVRGAVASKKNWWKSSGGAEKHGFTKTKALNRQFSKIGNWISKIGIKFSAKANDSSNGSWDDTS